MVLTMGLFVLAIISGMLGLGVAFAAVPFLSFFMQDLVHQVQPVSLLLNGVTALFAAFGFAQSGYVHWKKAGALAAVTTLFAPFGAYFVQFVPQIYIWYVYLLAVAFLAYKMFSGTESKVKGENLRLAIVFAVPVSILSGFIGVGPGFLLMPILILLGFDAKKAAGINAIAVTPPSFSAVLPHLATAEINMEVMIPLLVVGAIGSFLGARLSSKYLPSIRLKQIFGILIVCMTAYKIYTLLRI